MPNISKVSDRSKLKSRREPYWLRLSKGCFIGYRRMTPGSEGSWLSRWYDTVTGKYVLHALGDFTELPANERYDAAVKAAQVWFAHLGHGGSSAGNTILDICASYVQHQLETRGEKAAKDAEDRFASYVLDDPRFAEMDAQKLTPAHIENWRRKLRKRPTESGGNRGGERSDSSMNRDMTPFRAALNLAYKDGIVTTDFAWKNKLRPIPGADKQREIYLDRNQRDRLIAAADTDLRLFLQAMNYLPLRPGAVAALRVSDFDPRLKTLLISVDKAGAGRKIPLPDAVVGFIGQQCRDKLPSAYVFSRADGKPWTKDAWKKPVRAAVTKARLPADVTCYSLRHSTITDLVRCGADTMTVAKISGTSIKMIDQHYGHLNSEHARAALATLHS